MSNSIQDDFNRILQMVEAIWRAIAALEKKLQALSESRIPRHAPLPEPAWAVEVQYRDDGRAFVRINRGDPFRLTPKLARLVAVLISGDEPAVDGMTPWKPLDHVRRAMADEPNGVPMSRRALDQLIHRLGIEFSKRGYHAGLIQRHATKRSIRFALRPASPPLLSIEEEHT